MYNDFILAEAETDGLKHCEIDYSVLFLWKLKKYIHRLKHSHFQRKFQFQIGSCAKTLSKANLKPTVEPDGLG